MYEGYNATITDHLKNPRNAGDLPGADVVATDKNDYCGDIMRLALKVVDGKIADLRFKTFGCGISIAAGSMMTVLAQGKTVAEARQVTESQIAEALGGLAPEKLHGAQLAAMVLEKAVAEYCTKNPNGAGAVGGVT